MPGRGLSLLGGSVTAHTKQGFFVSTPLDNNFFNQLNIKCMKTNEILNYEAPQVEIIEVEVEKGFAASGIDDMPYLN